MRYFGNDKFAAARVGSSSPFRASTVSFTSGSFEIAVITVEPADKTSFVYSCMQTRLKGQYNEK